MHKILLQLDSDAQPSSFDRVVAIDADVDQLFSYGGVQPEQVTALVHGAIFTRGPKDLHHTAIYIGGGDVGRGEALLQQVLRSFVGPMKVSVMLDANGSNTTAAAAVLAARKHLDLALSTAVVLGGTGPVGQRAALLLAGEGAKVRLASRSLQRAAHAAKSINYSVPGERVEPVEATSNDNLAQALAGAQLVIAAGAPGVKLLPQALWQAAGDLRVLIDLNAVPPLGIEGVGVMDKAVAHGPVLVYGAIGVGGAKMKIHKAAIAALFQANDQVLDAASIFALAKTL